MAVKICNSEELLTALEHQCHQFTDKYHPLTSTQLASIKAATALVNHKSTTRNHSKRRVGIILRDLWTHVQEAFILCALATTQTSLAPLNTNDYLKVVQIWWEAMEAKPRGLSDIIRYHSDILPTNPNITHYPTVATTVATLAKLMFRMHGDRPLFINCPFDGVPPPFIHIQVSPELEMKVELSMKACSELFRITEEGSAVSIVS